MGTCSRSDGTRAGASSIAKTGIRESSIRNSPGPDSEPPIDQLHGRQFGAHPVQPGKGEELALPDANTSVVLLEDLGEVHQVVLGGPAKPIIDEGDLLSCNWKSALARNNAVEVPGN